MDGGWGGKQGRGGGNKCGEGWGKNGIRRTFGVLELRFQQFCQTHGLCDRVGLENNHFPLYEVEDETIQNHFRRKAQNPIAKFFKYLLIFNYIIILSEFK